MPQLGETVTEGTVGRWLKKVGERVKKYEPLLEVETDKVASEIPSPFAGTLSKIIVNEGDTAAVGAPLCEITAADAGQTAGNAEGGSVRARPAGDGLPASPPQAAPASAPPARANGGFTAAADGTRYSPAVRKLARSLRIDLRAISGTGRGGRVTASDVMSVAKPGAGAPVAGPAAPSAAAFATVAAQAPAAGPASLPPVVAGPDDTVVKLTPIRKTIAERMAFSRSTIPFAWSIVEADVSDLVKWREREKPAFKQREGVNLTYVPVVVRAVCAALREFPGVNAAWAGDHIIVRKHLNVGIAVDAEDGLVVPVVRDADRYSLAGLAQAIAELADKARRRRLTMEDLADGTITVNNTGALGSVASVPIINPPQAAIVTLEAIVRRPWALGEAIAIRSIMNLCLCFDHRVFDGGTASRFLQSLKRGLENFSESM